MADNGVEGGDANSKLALCPPSMAKRKKSGAVVHIRRGEAPRTTVDAKIKRGRAPIGEHSLARCRSRAAKAGNYLRFVDGGLRIAPV